MEDSHVHVVVDDDSSSMKPTGASSASPVATVLDLEAGGGSSETDYGSRANWLRAAVLGATDGLVSVASLMIGVGAVDQTSKVMVISGLAGLIAGACSMAIGEYVSVCTQYDIQKAQMVRDVDDRMENLPSAVEAAGASALAFSLGGLSPLLVGGFIKPHVARVVAVCAVTSLGLGGFGVAGGLLGGTPVKKSAIRVIIGGWLAMLITYGVLWPFGLAFNF